MEGKTTARSGSTTLTLAFTLLLLAPVARVLFPRLYVMGEDASFVAVGLLGVLVFSAPALASVSTVLSPHSAAVSGLALVVVARLGVQFVHPIPAWLAFAATAMALAGATGVFVGLSRRRSLRVLPYALIGGLALDTAARVPTGSWELVWQGGATPGLVALATAGCAAWSLAVAMRGTPAPEPGLGIPAPALAAVGPYLMLQLLFLQNLGFVGTAAGVSFPLAVGIVLMADAVAIAAASVGGILQRRGASWPFAGGAIVVAMAAVLPRAEGATAMALVVLLQGAATGCIALACDRGSAASGGRLIVPATLAGLGFLSLALLWQIHITLPLPFPRAVVPAVAAAWLAITAFLSLRDWARAPIIGRRRGIALAGGAVAIASVIGLMTAAWWPGAPFAIGASREVRVVTLNVRGATGSDAMVDPDAIADAIRASDPDVVILQEVARGWPVFGAQDLLARLRQRLGMSYVYEPAADGQFGNVVLSRLAMTRVAGGPLPDVPGKQRRSFALVRVETAAGPLVVAAAHLESDDPAQVEALLAAVNARPAIVAGDLNMETTDAANVSRFVDAGLVDAEGATGDPCRTTSAEPTSTCDRPDWVWVSRDLAIARFTIGAGSASDHLPVSVTVTMPT